MLRPNMMHSYNKNIKRYEIDDELDKFGGTKFNNCFTPSPDTPRSLACLWSGLYPERNGCIKRISYPKHYLNENNPTMLEIMSDRGYEFNFFINVDKLYNGVLPRGYETKGYHNKDQDLQAYLDDIEIGEKSFTYIDISDFHYANDDYGHHYYGTKIGNQKVSNALKIIRNSLDITNFDLQIIFSDHGHKLIHENKTEPKYKLLNSDRSKILMMLKIKRLDQKEYDNKLCSIMDVFPTVLEIFEVDTVKGLDGISLLSNNEHEHIIAQDHFIFSPQINQDIDIWAVIRKEGFYFRTLEGYNFENEQNFIESPEELDKLIEEKSPSFSEYIKEKEMLAYYKRMASERSIYSDGTPRVNYLHKFKFKHMLYRFYARFILQKAKGILYE